MKAISKAPFFSFVVGLVGCFGILLSACGSGDGPTVQKPGKLTTGSSTHNLEVGFTLPEPGRLDTDQPNDRLTFENVPLNTIVRKKILLYNSGSQNVTVNSVWFKNNDNDGVFLIMALPVFPITLAPGKRNGREITIGFKTDKSGEYQTQLQVTSPNASNVNISGHFFIDLRHIQKRLCTWCNGVGLGER